MAVYIDAGTAVNLWVPLAPILCNTAKEQTLANNTLYRNSEGFFLGMIAPNVQLFGNKMIDNGVGISWFHMCYPTYSARPQLKDNLFVAYLDGASAPTTGGFRGGLLMPEIEFGYASGATFVNYGSTGAITSCKNLGCVCIFQRSTPLGADAIDPRAHSFRFERVGFINTTTRVNWDRSDILMDLDGSLTGAAAGSTLIPYTSLNAWPECIAVDADAPTAATARYRGGGLVCPPSNPARAVRLKTFSPWWLWDATTWFTADPLPGSGRAGNAFTPAVAGRRFAQRANAFGQILVSGHSYGVAADTDTEWNGASFFFSQPEYLGSKEWIALVFRYFQNRYSNDGYTPSREAIAQSDDLDNNYPPKFGQVQAPMLRSLAATRINNITNALPGIAAAASTSTIVIGSTVAPV